MSDKREKILQGALTLFTQKGIDSTSTASIAKAAGVGTGTVFNYFSNKEELVNECFFYVKKKLMDSLEEVECDDFMEKTFLCWKVAIEWFLENEVETQFMNIYEHDPKINKGKSLSITIEMATFIMKNFTEAKELGVMKDFSIDYFCLLAKESTVLTARYLAENPDVDRDSFIQNSCELFLKGVLKN